MSYKYRDVEKAITYILGETDLPKLRASVRYLRALGCPKGLIGRGKGEHLDYSLPQAIEMLLGISLVYAGLTPTVATTLIKASDGIKTVPYVHISIDRRACAKAMTNYLSLNSGSGAHE